MPDLPKLDRIDINILVQLQKDGAVSNLLLAEQVGLSPSPCLQRVKRLEKAALHHRIRRADQPRQIDRTGFDRGAN
jgi:DNA-binding Lrp family transcriptional regulator